MDKTDGEMAGAGAADTGRSQTAVWNGAAGQGWVAAQALLDRLFDPFERLLVDAAATAGASAVLDIGCGTGGTTLAVARALAPYGRAVGIDISGPMIAAAEARPSSVADGLPPAQFVLGDAGTYPFEAGGFDRLLSRFGVMFFDDPAAAFANLRRAASPVAALDVIAWRRIEENPFMVAAETAAAPLLPDLPPRIPDAPGQFGFADAGRVRRILTDSGWAAIDIRAVDADCVMPLADLETYMTLLGPVGAALRDADPDTRSRIVERLRTAFDPYVTDGAVRFTAACWRIAARAEVAAS